MRGIVSANWNYVIENLVKPFGMKGEELSGFENFYNLEILQHIING